MKAAIHNTEIHGNAHFSHFRTILTKKKSFSLQKKTFFFFEHNYDVSNPTLETLLKFSLLKRLELGDSK